MRTDTYSHQDEEAFFLGARLLDGDDQIITERVSGKALLILEDYDAIRASLSAYFRTHYYDVFSAGILSDASSFALNEHPSIILIDYYVNGLNGGTALTAIAHLRVLLPRSTIVLIGGPNTPEIKERAKLLGADHILSKASELCK